jgi:transcriptional regulator with XRE-family HTH domain
MKDENHGAFAQRLKEVRKKLNIMTQREFAEKIEMPRSYVSGIESGRIMPGFDFFFKITRIFKINPVYLLHGEPPVFLEESMPEEKPGDDKIEMAIKEMSWYMEHSDIVHYGMIEQYSRYMTKHRAIIDAELKQKGIDPESFK